MGHEQILANRYTLVSPLGRGGMGQVWEARDTLLDRKVAVKLLTVGAPATRRDSGSDVRRFAREAAVTAGFTHPSVPAIFDAGDYTDGLYLVMELVEGCTIGDLVAEQGPLPVAWAAAVAGQVAAVLAVAHRRGILHRDIKPENVMLTTDGTAKILDFGVAGIVSQRITSTGITVGTPGYIAPEQLHNLPATPQTDLYALGCLMYEMLAAEPVFTASSPAALIRMHLEQAPPALRRRDVHPQLESLLWRLLDKDPARRPTDARQVYDLLLPFVSPAGPLGDINPEAGSLTGMLPYSRLLARLSEADPGSPVPQESHLPTPAPIVRRSRRWTVRHSLWILPTLLLGGVGAWLSFGYIAARHQRWSWLAAAAAYLVLAATAFGLMVSGPVPATGPLGIRPDIGATMLAVLWPTAIIHALWVNFKGRLPLLGA